MHDLIAEAKKLITAYGENVREQRLEDILSMLCEDASIHLPQTVPLEGKDSIRTFYEKNFSKGDYHFNLEFTDEKEVADLIFVNGLMDKNFTSAENQSKTNYDFSFILKMENDFLKIFLMRLV